MLMKTYEVVIRLAMAILIGGAIGYEREYKNRPAGFRTHILVCLGACVITMIQVYEVENVKQQILMHPELASALKADIGRLGAQVISGVGFLGAGTIIHEKGSVKGLTTAASLWVVACIGLACGLGLYTLSLFSTIAVEVALVSLKKVETRFLDRTNEVKIQVECSDGREAFRDLTEYFKDKNIKVKNIDFFMDDCQEEPDGDSKSMYTVLVPKNVEICDMIRDIKENKEIRKIEVK